MMPFPQTKDIKVKKIDFFFVTVNYLLKVFDLVFQIHSDYLF